MNPHELHPQSTLPIDSSATDFSKLDIKQTSLDLDESLLSSPILIDRLKTSLENEVISRLTGSYNGQVYDISSISRELDLTPRQVIDIEKRVINRARKFVRIMSILNENLDEDVEYVSLDPISSLTDALEQGLEDAEFDPKLDLGARERQLIDDIYNLIAEGHTLFEYVETGELVINQAMIANLLKVNPGEIEILLGQVLDIS